MHIRNPKKLFQEAGAADYVIPGFYVDTADQAAGILDATGARPQLVAIRFKITGVEGLLVEATRQVRAPVVLQAVVDTRAHMQAALDVDITAYTLRPDAGALAHDLHSRGAFVEVESEDISRAFDRETQLSPQGVYIHSQTTRGAFTGSSYVMFDALTSHIPEDLTVAVALQLTNDISPAHVEKLAELPISQIVFDVRGIDRMQAARIATRMLAMLTPQNTATIHPSYF